MLDEIARRYCLSRELKRSTEKQIHSVVKVWNAWAKTEKRFTAESVSEFLRYKQEIGRSSYYRRSLRSTLVALLRFAGDGGIVRPVRRSPINPDTWGAAEVRHIIDAIPFVVPRERCEWWESLITAAWYTGLSICDLLNMERKNVQPDGTVVVRRAKTGSQVVAWIPPETVDSRGFHGKLWETYCKREWFRLTWNRIVKTAGLSGPFKKLRRSSGTSVEKLFPGQGHKHLANLRSTFERHYLGEIKRSALIPERI